MKIIIVFVLLLVASSGYSEVNRTTGVGLIVGAPTGVNFKHFTVARKTAVEFDFSIAASKIYLTASYLWHDYEALPSVEEGEVPIFYGPTLAVFGNNPAIGGTLGVAYVFAEYPFDIVLKLSPSIIFDKTVNATFIGGIGARYFFR